MKIKTYKVIPVMTEMICDCGEKMRPDTDGMDMFMALLNKKELTYKYKCPKCNKEFISKEDYKLGEVRHIYGELIEEKEVRK